MPARRFPGKECISQGSMDAGANIYRDIMYIAKKNSHGCEECR